MTDNSDLPDYLPLILAQWEPDDVARHIARMLREGKPSPMFLVHLSHLFERPKKTTVAFKAVIKRAAPNRPKKPHDAALGLAMIEAMNAKAPGEKSKDVAERIGKQHGGVSWSTAYKTWERQKRLDAADAVHTKYVALQKSR